MLDPRTRGFHVARMLRELAPRIRLREQLGERLRRVVVFGSVARGEAHEESDVDVLVLIEAPSSAERRRALDIAGELTIETLLVLAPVVQSVAEWDGLRARERRFVREVEQDGVEV